ncbi:hypothetical protein ACS0TY_033719 [Phlomoides rotata]
MQGFWLRLLMHWLRARASPSLRTCGWNLMFVLLLGPLVLINEIGNLPLKLSMSAEGFFISYLKSDIRVVRELPMELQSLDLKAIGSIVRFMLQTHIMKEAKPSFYLNYILLILHLNRVVHFVGFGNKLASDPIPHQLQSKWKGQKLREAKKSRYLALHLRFEIDMVAHSLCEFGGGEEENRELEAYREIHFPALVELKKTKRFPSPTELRSEGLCPLMPEKTVLMLAGLGFNRRTHIYLAGAHIYEGSSRLAALTTLFPNLVTKEKLLSSVEIEPFLNFSSQINYTLSLCSAFIILSKIKIIFGNNLHILDETIYLRDG